MTFNFSGSFEMINAANHFSRLNGWSQREARGAIIDMIEVYASKKTDRVPRRLLVEAIGEVAVQALIDFEACGEDGDHVICHESSRILAVSKANSDNGKRSAEAKKKKAQFEVKNSTTVEKQKSKINKRSTTVEPSLNDRSTNIQPISTTPQPHDHTHDHTHDHHHNHTKISFLSETSENQVDLVDLVEPEKPKPKSEHHELIEKLCDEFEQTRCAKYPFSARDAKVVADLRKIAPSEQIQNAWAKALRHSGFPSVGTLAQLQQNFAMFVGTGPPITKSNVQKVTEVGVFNEAKTITGDDLPWRSKRNAQ